jgi:precorrin-2 C20-methyltransferase / precorrin-3B C17-methyltransferase
VVVGRAVGTDDQQITVTTLADLDIDRVDMRCLLIVGSSRSRVVTDAGRTRVITPRRYPG